ncbi:hypothetical protein [Chryseobacterium sp. JM1]|uniref:hypothetical protein n=1 Tax=Chryseobacterium sp. JM1 TaxID=1233950 RepID=UPI0004E696A4|nr:hypothetical protein [Chryseobacterium sp. JM1]KFF21306.1 hypothetical protein IW22_09955 [Chryseobacterium sp. JM1]
MKKLLFIAALGAVGVMSAKEIKKENISVKNKEVVTGKVELQNVKEQTKRVIVLYNWIGVSTWCGKVFYLDANDYSSMAELNSDAAYFTNQQCAGASTFTGQYT